MSYKIQYQLRDGFQFSEINQRLFHSNGFYIEINREPLLSHWAISLSRREVFNVLDLRDYEKVVLEELTKKQFVDFHIKLSNTKTIILRKPDFLVCEVLPQSLTNPRLCPYSVIKLSTKGPVLSHPLAKCEIEFLGKDIFQNYHFIFDPMENGSLISEEEKKTWELLSFLGFLTSNQEKIKENLVFWDPVDLAFHMHSQRVPLLESGSTLRPNDDLPIIKVKNNDKLTKTDAFFIENKNFQKDLQDQCERKTTRVFGDDKLLKKSDVVSFLIKALSPKGSEKPSWPWPGPGGIYNFNFYLLVNSLEDVPSGLYCFNALTSEVDLVNSKAVDRLIFSKTTDSYLTNGKIPPLILIITADFPLVSRVYEKIAYRVQLITVGTILQNLYQNAEKFNIGIRPIGATNNKLVEDQLMGLEKLREVFMLHVEMGSLPKMK